jgi:hypothetical protein
MPGWDSLFQIALTIALIIISLTKWSKGTDDTLLSLKKDIGTLGNRLDARIDSIKDNCIAHKFNGEQLDKIYVRRDYLDAKLETLKQRINHSPDGNRG